VPPRAQLHQTLPLCQGGLRHCHVSSVSRPHLPAREGSGATTCIMALDPTSLLRRALEPPYGLRLRTLPPCREGFGTATHPTVPYGSLASSIKKNLPGLPKQLGSHVSKAHTHVSETLDVRAIMGLQDMRASDAFSAYKTCGQTVTLQLQYHAGPVDHSQGTTAVLGDLTTRCHTVDQVCHGWTTRQDIPHVIEGIICYF
jgi:hypothetical protein